MTQQTVRPEPKGGRGNLGRLVRLIPSYAGLVLLTLVFVAPLLWMLSTSLKPNFMTTRFPPQWIPQGFSNEGYSTILTTSSANPVLQWFLNSLIAASAHTVLVLVTASMAAYALARMHFRGQEPDVRGHRPDAGHTPVRLPHRQLPDRASTSAGWTPCWP